MHIRDLGIDPVSEVGDFGVDSELAGVRTAKAPADSSDQSLCIVVGRVGDEERTTTVSLASILASLHETGTQHVWGHVLVHLSAIAVSEHGNVNLMESGRRGPA